MTDTRETTIDKIYKEILRLSKVREMLEYIECEHEHFREDLIEDAYAHCDRAQYLLNIAHGELEFEEDE